MKNFLLIFRKLKKNKTATSLGIAGLVIGMMCVVYIFLLVTQEISFDRFHEKTDRIFVVHAYLEGGTEKVDFPGCPPAVSTALKSEYPEVETTCRYIPPYFQYLVSSGENKFTERTAMADFTIFDIFSFPFVYGSKGESNVPNRVILTKSASERYFGTSSPVGKIVRMDNRIDMVVAGVIKDIPDNSSISFDAIIPLENIGVYYSRTDYLTSWYNNSFTTYGLLTRPEGYEKVASTITRRIQKEIPESTNYLKAYKFKDGYLYEQKHIQTVRIFSLIALLVLLAATLNFINLNTARSAKQAKETGLRKTFGATRTNVVKLIYSEVALICFLAFALAIILDYTGLPLINKIIGKGINFKIIFSPAPLIILIVLYLFTVFLAGSYPAFFLSSFTPGQILSSNFQTVKSRGIFRNTLVIVMFVISIILLTSTILISKQTDFMQKMDLGFEKDQLMYVSLKGKLQTEVQALKQELGHSSGVVSSSAVSMLPIMIGNNGEQWNWEGKDPNFKPLVTEWQTDEDLVKTFGAKMIEGDYLNKNQDGIVINKTFADLIGWNSYTGKTLKNGDSQYRILGVIKDIHFNSLSTATKPMAIEYLPNPATNYLVIKVNTGDISNTLNFITKTCQTIEPAYPVDYAFFNEKYKLLLASEINLRKLVGIFSIFAIVVLCLGMLGMVMFLIEQKTKEIGVRKCLGENVMSIILQLIKPFLVSGIIAGVIAIPVTWYIMSHWLQNYSYRIHLNIGIFIFAGLITVGIAMVTVFWESLMAAMRNPVQALRYE
jgi:putative ABC transport system permease protein